MKNLISILLCFIFISCTNQLKKDKQSQSIDTIKPEINIKVNKTYNDKGNLISIDSSYIFFYSNIKNDSILEKEIFDNFKIEFENQLTIMDSIFMNDFFIKTPALINGFYTNHYFQNYFNLNHKRIENVFKQMDSLKNDFYIKQNENLKK